MEYPVKILIVEDDMIIAANISLQLTNLGYEISGIETKGKGAMAHVKLNQPDIVLMDINLKGELNGIQTVENIQRATNIPVIYLTANSDEHTFNMAKATRPYAFISKPFNPVDLERTVALVVEQMSMAPASKKAESESLELMNDRIFIRHNGRMVRLLLDEILYIEADRNYCNIVTPTSKYLLVSTLKTIENKLSGTHFIRVHRSFIVNLSKLDVVADGHLEIRRKVIPISRSNRENLMSRLHTI